MLESHDPRAAMLAAERAVQAADPEPERVVTSGGVIRVDLRMGDGRELRGEFVFDLPLSVNAQTKIGNVSSRMRGGLPLAAFSDDKAGLIEMVAYLQVALTSAPLWACDESGRISLGELPTMLVEHLYGEVAEHAARFRDACQLRGPAEG